MTGREEPANLLQGTLDLLILKSLKPGSLFPALHRMEQAGWLESFWGQSENNRKAKYYRLSRAGRGQLERELAQWSRISGAIEMAIQAG